MRGLSTLVALTLAALAGCQSGPRVVATIEVPGTLGEIAVGEGAVWALRGASRGDEIALLRIDPVVNRVVATIPIGITRRPFGLAAGQGGVWVVEAGGSHVFRFDPVSNRMVAKIRVGPDPVYVAAGEEGVWVVTDGGLVRIDPVTNSASDTVPIPRTTPHVAVGGGSVWISKKLSGTVVRIASTPPHVAVEIAVGEHPEDVVVRDGGAWVLERRGDPTRPQPSFITRIDLSTNRVVGQPVSVGAWAHLAFGGGWLWVGVYEDKRGKVSQIDPRTLRVVGRPIEITPHVSRVAFGFDSLWVVTGAPGVIRLVKP